MALLNRRGMATWRIRPKKESVNEVMKMPLWARMIGRARRSQLSDLSGSMPAGGASFRASSAIGTNWVPVSAGPFGRGRRVGAFIGPTVPGCR